jgi:hypothetical protein
MQKLQNQHLWADSGQVSKPAGEVERGSPVSASKLVNCQGASHMNLMGCIRISRDRRYPISGGFNAIAPII